MVVLVGFWLVWVSTFMSCNDGEVDSGPPTESPDTACPDTGPVDPDLCAVPAGGACEPGDCVEGTVCDDGICLPTLGADCSVFACATGLACEDDLCVVPAGGACEPGDCAEGTVCDDGACLPTLGADCAVFDCATGLVCEDDRCVVPAGGACEPGDCVVGTVCDDGSCLPTLGADCAVFECATGLVCDVDRCVVPAGGECEPGDCAEGTVCDDGVCLPALGSDCWEVDCADGLVCEDDRCVVPAGGECEPGDCAEGTVCDDGVCLPTLHADCSEFECAADLVCEDDLCLVPAGGECEPGDCVEGTDCDDGVCLPTLGADCSVFDCATGLVCALDLCLVPAGGACEPGDCVEGTVCHGEEGEATCLPTAGGSCDLDLPCAGDLSCEEETCRIPHGGACDVSNDLCAEGSACDDGEGEATCVPTGGQTCGVDDLCADDLPTAEHTPFLERVRFLFDPESATDPVQTDLDLETLDPARVAVLRGRVTDPHGAPLAGVTVRVVGRPALGQTLSRADGEYDLVVNGGGLLTVELTLAGSLPARRRVDPAWSDFVQVPTAVLVPLAAQVATVDLSSTAPAVVQVVTAPPDPHGRPPPTLLVPPGIEAMLEGPGPSTTPVDSLDLRLTPYPPDALPAPLAPGQVAALGLELSADEALAVGADRVTFDRPVLLYLDDPVGLPAGTPIPAGFFDRHADAWIGAPNGRALRILGVDDAGHAELDLDGSELAASPAELEAAGISAEETAALAERYAAGQRLWRVATTHFSSWTVGWPVGLPSDADPEQLGPLLVTAGDEPDDCVRDQIACLGQSRAVRVPIAGSPWALTLRTDRAPSARRQVTVPLTGPTPSPSLLRVEVELTVAGQHVHATYAPAPDLSHTFVWDGRDAYGRPTPGAVPITALVRWVYPADLLAPFEADAAFGLTSGTGDPLAVEVALDGAEASVIRTDQALLGNPVDATQVGGFDLDALAAWDPAATTLTLGSGYNGPAGVFGAVVHTVAGTGDSGHTGDGGPAIHARLNNPAGLAFGPDGSLYIADRSVNVVRRVWPDGTISTVAGMAGAMFIDGREGILATESSLRLPDQVAVASDGTLYVVASFRVRRVDPQGLVWNAAGSTSAGFSGDGGPAVEAQVFGSNMGIGLAPDGALLIADHDNHRVRRVGHDGVIWTVAGSGPVGTIHSAFDGDGEHATSARLSRVVEVAVRGDGAAYVVDQRNYRVRHISPFGRISTVAGRGNTSGPGENILAIDAGIGTVRTLALDRRGNLYLALSDGRGFVRQVNTSGRINTIVGTEDEGLISEGAHAWLTEVNNAYGVAVSPRGRLCYSDVTYHRVRCLGPPEPPRVGPHTLVPSRDGREVYVFDANLRHVETRDVRTGALRLSLLHDAAGRLLTITDAAGRVTSITRDPDGTATALVAPSGLRTDVVLDANGRLASLDGPGGARWEFDWTADGSLAQATEPSGATTSFAYDAFGRLVAEHNAGGAVTTLARAQVTGGHEVVVTTAEGRSTAYRGETPRLDAHERLVTPAHGVAGHYERRADGVLRARHPDGTAHEATLIPDPRFSLLAPVVSGRTVSPPGGPAATTSRSRATFLADPEDPFSVTSFEDVRSIGARDFTTAYDPVLRMWRATSPSGRQRHVAVDPKGQIEALLAPAMHLLEVLRDAFGRVSGVVLGDGDATRAVTYAYGDGDRVAAITDPLGGVTEVERDPAGDVVGVTFPGGHGLEVERLAGGAIARIEPHDRPAHTYAYDPTGRLVAYHPPLVDGGDGWTYTYDDDGLLVAIGRPDDQAVTVTRDAAGRPTAVVTPHGDVTTTWHVDTAELAQVAAGPVTVSFARAGPLALSETWAGVVAGEVSASWDASHRLADLRVQGETPIARSYDADDLLVAAGDLTLTRDPDTGFIVTKHLGDLEVTQDWDAFGELASIVVTDTVADHILFAQDYTTDLAGRLVAVDEVAGGSDRALTFDYNDSGYLRETHIDGALAERYLHDPDGRRRYVLSGALGEILADAIVHDAQDRLVQFGAAGFTWTPAGELATRTDLTGTTTYDYDTLGRLGEVVLPDDTVVDYLADGLGRRVARRVDGVTTHRWLHWSTFGPVAEVDEEGEVITRFVYATQGHVPDVMIRGEARYLLVRDHLGSVRLVVDADTGEVAQALVYDAWGNVVEDTAPGFQPFGFAGGLSDPATGLVRLGARDYDPAVGRWTARPSDGGPGLLSGYLYAGGDPLNRIDVEGLGRPTPSERFTRGAGATPALATSERLRDALDVTTAIDPCAGTARAWDVPGLRTPRAPRVSVAPFDAGPDDRPWRPARAFLEPVLALDLPR